MVCKLINMEYQNSAVVIVGYPYKVLSETLKAIITPDNSVHISSHPLHKFSNFRLTI